MSEIVSRAFALIDAIATADRPMRLMELVDKLNADKSAVHRLLRHLTECGFVTRDASSLQYKVGPAFLAMSSAAISRADFCAVARDYLLRVRDLTGETVGLHLKVGHERVCVDGVESQHDIRSALFRGERRPLYSGAGGKVILAFMGDDTTSAVLKHAAIAKPGVKALASQLVAIRKTGRAWDSSERFKGGAVLAVPIFDGNGIAGSLTVSGPGMRWTSQALRRHLPQIQKAVQQISSGLGSGEAARLAS